MEKIQIPKFATKAELFDFLIKNKSALVAQKKAEMKFTDAVSFKVSFVNDAGEETKAPVWKETPGPMPVFETDATAIALQLVINTTNVKDSHKDVHIPGIWKKSLSEIGMLYLCQEHELTYDGIISDEVKAFTKTIAWKKLGAPYEGSTQALVFKVVINKDDSPKMFERYCKGKVKNHSVRMQYVKLFLCIDDERYEEEKANWDKYITEVANKESADADGYFWAVTEAKVAYEGSAVPVGSNVWTPTLSIEDAGDQADEEKTTKTDQKPGAPTSTKIEPEQSTQKQTTFHNPNLY